MMQQQEGFDSTCAPLTDKTTCINTASCSWDEDSATCMGCSDYTECTTCSSVTKCGWCSDLKKCVASDRNGNAYGSACKPEKYIVSVSQCSAKVPSLPSLGSDSTFDMEKEIFDKDLPVQTYTEKAGGSCSTEKIVANVKEILDSNIKSIVRAELTSNKIPVIEGFSQDNILTLNILASINDDVRATTRKSLCATVTDAPLCQKKPACRWDIAEKQCVSK